MAQESTFLCHPLNWIARKVWEKVGRFRKNNEYIILILLKIWKPVRYSKNLFFISLRVSIICHFPNVGIYKMIHPNPAKSRMNVNTTIRLIGRFDCF